MSAYDKIYEIAADQYGLITTDEAKDLGIPNIELTKLAHRGKLKRLGYGLYRISRYIPTALDIYAEAVKMVGSDACLNGESVLALHNLIPTNPSCIGETWDTLYASQIGRLPVDPYVDEAIGIINELVLEICSSDKSAFLSCFF